ncbi:MAG TPA: type I-E CRISPR-associated protein Cas5/CasD [Thermoanaerobaculia bacterium]|jgi:CRISPR system Cascade subunit CasD|nr:type I-E CRISPR-associated protein Cas5/CasD [Thermoanaerobaculia bacterium]
MRSFLLFRLYGPLASWGEIAVGEVRPTALHPTRSALLGLLAAALGLRRGDDDFLSALGATLRFAIFVERAGVPARDYHTIQVATPRRGRMALTRADQLRERRFDLGTILSYRDYRCDALYDVAAWHEGDQVAFPLGRLEAALKRPVFTLYLGRKSCPLALPLGARVVEADSARVALESQPAPELKVPGDRYRAFPAQLPGSPLGLFWEGDSGLGPKAAESRAIRRDDPVSSARRIFRTRTEEFQAVDRHASPEDSNASEPDSPFS